MKISSVVYLLIPTSNHNLPIACAAFLLLYIFWFLHQTTTVCVNLTLATWLYIFWFLHQTTTRLSVYPFFTGCISFDSYIKPQPLTNANANASVVYLLIPTSNHNLLLNRSKSIIVVYLLIPTSNHNWLRLIMLLKQLYIFWFLHQTTTRALSLWGPRRCISFDSYIKPQLVSHLKSSHRRCISFDSYIKPQPKHWEIFIILVVYLLIPTSNHNLNIFVFIPILLYIFWFLHQTTTLLCLALLAIVLYIFWFLHQTTTCSSIALRLPCCISFDSYIKPQLMLLWCCKCTSCISFDSYIKPQLMNAAYFKALVVYLLIPTSNHNFSSSDISMPPVVYLLIPTSNHNCSVLVNDHCVLYIFWFLHQTTTWANRCSIHLRCISFDSYIKPQPCRSSYAIDLVVYLLIPTSNHNFFASFLSLSLLYIFWFLHQTTTRHAFAYFVYRLYIFWFLHQTTTLTLFWLILMCCISFDSYIKPQPVVGPVVSAAVVYLLIPTSNHNSPLPHAWWAMVVYLLIPTSNHN